MYTFFNILFFILTVDVIVFNNIGKPTTCDLMKVGDGENATLKCHVNCAYPQSEVQVQLFIDNKPTTEMPTMTDGDVSYCFSYS